MTFVVGMAPLASLARIGRLDAVAAVEAELLVPERVYRPLAEHAADGVPPARRTERAGDEGLFRVLPVPEGAGRESLRENPRLSRPDVATLALAASVDGTAVTDAEYTRRIARVERIDTCSTAYLVLEPVRSGAREAAAGLHLVELLLEAGWNTEPTDFAAVVRTLDRLAE